MTSIVGPTSNHRDGMFPLHDLKKNLINQSIIFVDCRSSPEDFHDQRGCASDRRYNTVPVSSAKVDRHRENSWRSR